MAMCAWKNIRWGCQCPTESLRCCCFDNMYPIEPGAGAFCAMADAFARAIISDLERPASTHRVLSKFTGNTELAAAAFRQSGPRILGFQKTGSSKEANQERSTRHTNPFFPAAADS